MTPAPARSFSLLLQLTVVSLALGALPAGATPPPERLPPGVVLTTAAQVRALTVEQARLAFPVQLHGVFVGEADPEGIAFVIYDATEGIYIQGPAEVVAGLQRGDLLEITGETDPGGFAPYVVAQRIEKIGRAPLPEPTRLTLDALSSGQMDAKWVEISGTVRSVEPKQPGDTAPPPSGTRYAVPEDAAPATNAPQRLKMKLASGTTHVVVEVDAGLPPAHYIDAEVRLRGLCFNLHNRNRQFVRPFVQVPRGMEVEIVRPPPSAPFASEPAPISSLLQFDELTGRLGHRVHVRGVVLHHRPGAALWVRDHDRSLRVETSQRDPLQPGDEVDVLGFPAPGDYSAVLEDAVFRKRASGPAPVPQALESVSHALMRDADLVQLEARLADVRRFPERVLLTLDWHDTVIRAELVFHGEEPPPGDWAAGGIVRVSGICSVSTEEGGPLGGLWEPRSFQLLLRAPSDLAILQPPPWWDAERTAWVLSGLLALAVGAVGLVMLASRRRLAEQEHRRAMAEAEFTAILSERNRVAREIHDTLSQSLGAISVQLELARLHAHELSTPVRNHLGAALKLARGALADARESIWNMRSHVLEKGDLADALLGILTRMTKGSSIQPSLQVEGERRRLPPMVENNLLRIGQEAITNACKHARPSRIDVLLSFEGRTVCLAVEDDGVGFPAESPRGHERRSFGLVGIRERAELLAGTIDIRSTPGHGTRIAVTVSA